MFYFDELNGKKILKSDELSGLIHLFTTRETVIKTKEPELEQLVEDNKSDIIEYLNIQPENFIHPSQTHTDNIEIAEIGKSLYPDTDALILNNHVQGIYLNFADCTPVILYDKIKNIAAIAHAGWRGTAKSIAPKTVQKMCDDFGCKPENITAAIGPAISLCCYDVGEEVFDALKTTVKDFTGLSQNRGGKIYVDLKSINARQLEEIGIKKIDICPYCTVCDNDMFFSYRKEHATTSRHSAVVKLA